MFVFVCVGVFLFWLTFEKTDWNQVIQTLGDLDYSWVLLSMAFGYSAYIFRGVRWNLLIKPLALFGIDAVVQNRVGASEYGTYFSLLNLSILFNILLDIGINNYTTKIAAQDAKKAIDYFGKVISLRILLFLLYSLTILNTSFILIPFLIALYALV